MTDNAVSTALQGYRDGLVTWPEVVDTVRGFQFVPRPPIAPGADYVTVGGSFEDTVTPWLQRRVITRDEWRQLRAIWKSR